MCVISVNPLLILKIKILPEIQEFLCCLVIKSAYNLMCPFQEVCSRFAQILFIRSHSSILPASHKKCFHRIWWPMTSHQEATADSYLSKLPDKQRGGTFMSHLPSLGLSLPMFSSFFPPDGHSGGIRKMLHLERQVRRWKRKRKLCFCDCCFPLGIATAAFISSRWHFRRTRLGSSPDPPAVTPVAAVTSTFLLIRIIWLALIRCFDNPEGQRAVSLLIQSSGACRARPPWPSANCGYWLIALVNIYWGCCACADVRPLRLCVTFQWCL